MTERGPDFSRSGRKKNQKRSSAILNSLIGVVVLLIIIVAATIFWGNDDDGQAENAELITTDGADNEAKDTSNQPDAHEDDSQVNDANHAAEGGNSVTDGTKPESSNGKGAGTSEGTTTKPDAEPKKEADSIAGDGTDSGSVTYVTSDDDIIAETVIKAWQPIGTTQSGDHVSQYNSKSVDWHEKQQALAYATGLPQDSMIFWKIKSDGGPQKSVGIVSSSDKAEKYRVHLEWVDGQGWKPVKMDVLKTLDFEY